MNLFFAKGIGNLYKELVENWLGPIYLIAVAIFAIVFLKDRKFRELFSFIAIATIVALLIFFTKELFGQKEGLVTKSVGEAAKEALK